MTEGLFHLDLTEREISANIRVASSRGRADGFALLCHAHSKSRGYFCTMRYQESATLLAVHECRSVLSTRLSMCRSRGCCVVGAKPEAHGMEILKVDLLRKYNTSQYDRSHTNTMPFVAMEHGDCIRGSEAQKAKRHACDLPSLVQVRHVKGSISKSCGRALSRSMKVYD